MTLSELKIGDRFCRVVNGKTKWWTVYELVDVIQSEWPYRVSVICSIKKYYIGLEYNMSDAVKIHQVG